MSRSHIEPSKEVSSLLTNLTAQYETPLFLLDDPSMFMHKVEGELNAEAMAFVASCLSYGSRKQFMPKVDLLLHLSDLEPYRWIMSGSFESDIPDEAKRCFYRLHTFHHLHQLLSAYKDLISIYGSIKGFIIKELPNRPIAAIEAIEAITEYFSKWDTGGLVPRNSRSCCKRLCMFLRWMVRDSSPIDLGLWHDIIDRRSLIMPLDTHVVSQAKRLGLLEGNSSSMSAALRLTESMRTIFPDDPLKGDFALFGYGVNDKK